jgi:hypothetical protein
MKTIASSVLLGYVSFTDAVKISSEEEFINPFTKGRKPMYNLAAFYSGIGDGPTALPAWNHEPFYADTLRYYNHEHLLNETSYIDDVPADYYDPTIESWVAMQQREDMRLGHKHHSRGHYHHHPKSLISFLGMTAAPDANMDAADSLLQT